MLAFLIGIVAAIVAAFAYWRGMIDGANRMALMYEAIQKENFRALGDVFEQYRKLHEARMHEDRRISSQ